MKFTVADVLDQLHTSAITPIDKLEKRLGLYSKDKKQQLSIVISALHQLGVIEKTIEGVQYIKDNTLIQARLRCSSQCFCFALRDDGDEDIYIHNHRLNHAWNGDRILVRIVQEGARKRSPEGEVLCILERQTTNLIAQLKHQNEKLIAVPLDSRIWATVDLVEETVIDLDPNHPIMAEVQIIRHPIAQLPAQGYIVRILSNKGDILSDRELLFSKYGLDHRYPSPHFVLSTPIAEDRKKITDQIVILLSGFDQAYELCLPGVAIQTTISLYRKPGIRLWIHAPLIAERIGLNTTLDLWLRERADALFVMGELLPLLNLTLTKDSGFKIGQTQSAISVALDLSADGELIHYTFINTLIRPVIKLDRQTMADLVTRRPKARIFTANVKPLRHHLDVIDQLLALGSQLRRRRLATGSVDLDSINVPIKDLGDQCLSRPNETYNGWMISTSSKEPFSLLRELIQVAHSALGHHLSTLGLPCIYAVNEGSDSNAINEIAKVAAGLDIAFDLNEYGNVCSLQELAIAFAATNIPRVLNQQLKAVIPGIILSSVPKLNIVAGEFGAYAPWTCGSLHYTDIFNQHVLSMLLSKSNFQGDPSPNSLLTIGSDRCHGLIETAIPPNDDLTTLEELVKGNLVHRLNARSCLSNDLLADGLALAQARQAESLLGQVLNGTISGVQGYGFFVEIPPFNIEGLVHISSLTDDWYDYCSTRNLLVGRKNHRAYVLGDPVKVRIQKVDVMCYQIDLVVDNLLNEDGSQEGNEFIIPISRSFESVEE